MQRLKNRKSGKTKAEILSSFVEDSTSLTEFSQRFDFFLPCLEELVQNKLRPLRTGITAKAECLNESEGRKIGGSLSISLAINLTASAGVDEWIHQFSALQEIDRENVWFRPMVEYMGYVLVGEVHWGVKFRVILGAVLSLLDILSDVLVSLIYYRNGQLGYFNSMVGMLAINCTLQFLAVFTAYHPLGPKRVLFEFLPCIFGIKSSVNAYRISTGHKTETKQVIDVFQELSLIKVTELAAEAIPGCIIQILAISELTGGSRTTAYAAMFLSALSAGFIAASMGYDWDTDPSNREMVRRPGEARSDELWSHPLTAAFILTHHTKSFGNSLRSEPYILWRSAITCSETLTCFPYDDVWIRLYPHYTMLYILTFGSHWKRVRDQLPSRRPGPIPCVQDSASRLLVLATCGREH